MNVLNVCERLAIPPPGAPPPPKGAVGALLKDGVPEAIQKFTKRHTQTRGKKGKGKN